MLKTRFLNKAVNLSEKSLKQGGFPAGTVLVTSGGSIYESDKSVAYFHGEVQVIKSALDKGEDLSGAVLYCSMEPCLMCSSCIYWAGGIKTFYIIPKSIVKAEYAYENSLDMEDQYDNFFVRLRIEQAEAGDLLDQAFEVYKTWVKNIEQ